ncbi:DUF5811 family protein [Halalkalicoccus subterraneus]|uniref:DUF5811 family protein n=1 Tax=Halalkalicoccus subterraneus TaxID=2675002 RepID=UPI000EFB3EF8|nr:DUF5811 family protein [Halalkalicoccus subterraneus]
MNGNTPYAGLPETTNAGQQMPDELPELTADQRRTLRADLSEITRRVRAYLPDEYVVGAEVSQGQSGPEAMVAVQPPIGHPISAGFEPDLDAEEYITENDREEVARGLAASAALQVKHAINDDISPTAR